MSDPAKIQALQDLAEKFKPEEGWTWEQWAIVGGITAVTIGLAIATGGVIVVTAGLDFGLGVAAASTASTVGSVATATGAIGLGGATTAYTANSFWKTLEDNGLVDPDKYTNGGKSTFLNRFFFLNLVSAKNDYEKEIINDDQVDLFLKEANDYLNNRAHNSHFFIIPLDIIDEIITEQNLEESRYIASYALSLYALRKDQVGNDPTKALKKKAIQFLSNGSFNDKFGIDSIIVKTAEKVIPYSTASKMISKGVRNSIRGLRSISVAIGDQFYLDKDYLTSGFIGAMTWEVFPDKFDKKPRLTDDILTDDIVAANSLNQKDIQWPKGVFGDSPDKLKELEEFDEIKENSDLSSYKFKFFEQNSYGFEKLIWGIDDGQNLIPSLIAGQYLDFISDVYRKVHADYVGTQGRSETISEISKRFFSEETTTGLNFINLIYSLIATDKEIARRFAFIEQIREIVKDPNRQPGALTVEEIELARKSGLNAFKKTEVENIKIEGLDEEAIKNLQKVFKQCALMININKLADDYNSDLLNDYSEMPYNGRFYVLKSGGANSSQETILSKLVSSEQEQELFELDPWQVSTLTPMFRLFKVMEDANGRTKEVEFIFERTSKIDRGKAVKGPDYTSPQHTFMSSGIDKGSGVGVKQFSIDFQGTNPAEARNDIKANLTLFFQSFTDFIRYRNSTSDPENTYRYVDLVIQPAHSSKVEILNTLQYDPSFYRIRADLGYYVPSFAGKKLKEAIEFSNKSFTLTMVDHDIKFNNDGSVEISIEYRAYLESLLKHPRLDALASPELIEKRIENSKKLADEINKRQCSKEQLRELQLSLQVQEEELIKKSLQSIMTRLIERGKIYNAQIKEEDKQHFINYGFFSECNLEILQENIDDQNVDIGKVMSTNLPEESDEFDFADSSDTLVQYFYFGDLLYTILDCVYDEQDKPREGLENNKIVLGSFEFDSFSSSGNNVSIYGINEMPISVDFFSRWFVDNITSQKNTRTTFPVLNFIRQLSNSLIRQSLIENCVNRKLEKNLRFQTGQITSFSKSGEPMAPISKKFFSNGETIINIDEARVDGLFPFAGGQSEKSDVNNYYNYIVLSAMGSTLTYTGTGKYSEDIKQGRFHVHLGQSSGLVKNISLSKTNQTYLKEARFFQNGIDGLLQLSNVYVATLEMFGNTIFYPGMEFFFNPYGLGGEAEFGRPQDQNSVAWKMGIGGYHTVTSVKTTLTPGKFSTTVTGQQYYSGDGSGNSNLKKEGLTKLKSINEYEPDWGSSGKEAKMEACATVIAQVQWGDKFVDNRTAEEIEEQFYPTSDNTDPAAEPIETESILPPESENNELTNLFELETSQQE